MRFPHTRTMEPAKSIITKCGGATVVAAWLGLNYSTVVRWTYGKDADGTGGFIPAKHQGALLVRAQAEGVPLTPADFFAAANDTASQERAA